ncbi:dihydroflavonol-4-reductase [Dyadobacter sp. BE34]|uniref:Dihydroflavonol-4-reductase n=1 Tax=Dyadobacter fermentans TaxID=94254 RepID=A0ABU1QXZ1_9BACT|nr:MULTISPECIES: aldehyde reductase [Dyadobacter]MDR6806029.1 dihydroflavonol-4-reductase [Dyadobacter fermentans]MDR7043770.1 dihydroflavonol-4-reductase [Dyadobacter sp. BE242]MDR7198081.1 dihydroflavonol-4-reductase [Dyadobacter sp. BE34]MDR7216044.1 dihydroflavonol-4-reductase [Dyadobacter sp. BE31]MDR7264430.1 dihydroflavonol-4-reductase [Dyadobacter sp. BE32]
MMNTNSNTEKSVLVTGGAGFIAVHCILQLLNAGYRVRTTLRDLNREPAVRAMLREGGVEAGERLTFIKADLSSDAHWDEAVKDCTYVLHVASPTPKLNFKHEDEMIIPAREGVLRVLRASKDAGVKRMVLTSAIGAIVYGHPKQTAPYDEAVWTDTTHAPAYQKSKTLAERAAWEFMKSEGGNLELAVVNPAAVMGPVLGPDYSHSIYLVKNLLTGKMAGCPKINSCFVDVRDVADLHLRAMLDPKANGERFIATGGESIWLAEVAKMLKANLGDKAGKVKAMQLPNIVLRIAALKDPMVKSMVPLLGMQMNLTSAKAIELLGWSPRSPKDAILAAAESLIRLNLL